jgi:hypothetical protein
MLHPAHSSRLKLQAESTWTRRTHSQRRRRRPSLEALETRALLSTLTVTNIADSGSGSLRAQIAAANSGDTIDFSSKLKGRMITLTTGELVVNKSLSVQGLGAKQLAVSGGGTSRLLDISGGATVSISGLTLTDGTAASGGAILNEAGSTLVITQSTLSGNEASGDASGNAQGGAIFNAVGAKLSIVQSLLTANSTDSTNQSFGGAVYNQGSASIVGSTFTGNSALGSLTLSFFSVGGSMGGAIMNDDGSTMTVSQCNFTGNQALGGPAGDALGGAIDNESWNLSPVGVTVSVTGSSFFANLADAGASAFDGGFGGAIEDLPGTTIAVLGSAFTKNEATANQSTSMGVFSLADGGAIDDGGDGDFFFPIPGQPAVSLTLAGSSFTGNSATGGSGAVSGLGNFGGGGAVNWGFSTGSITDSSFIGNQAVGEPGNTGFRGGTAQGGAIYAASTLTISNCALIGNQATGGADGGFAEGGGIDAYGGLTATKCVLIGNESQGGSGAPNAGPPFGFFEGYSEGGGINLLGENPAFGSTVVTATITDTTLIGNQALGAASSSGFGGIADGGGIDANDMLLNLNLSSLIGNSAVGGQGGPGGVGGYAFGGGIDVEAFSTANLTGSTFDLNSATGGAGGSGGRGGFGLGGGIAVGGVSFLVPLFSPDGSSVSVSGISLVGNLAHGGTGTSGGDALGGGIAVVGDDAATIGASAIDLNSAIGGSGSGGGDGGNGSGGGLFVDSGSSALVTGSSITRNLAIGGHGYGAGSDGQGIGGGVDFLGTFTFDSATKISNNHASTSGDNIAS